MGTAPSYVVLDRVVHLDKEAVEEESERAIMECRDRKTYLRDDHVGDEVVYGLSLLARLAEPPGLSKLSRTLPRARRRRPEAIPGYGGSVLDGLPVRALDFDLRTSIESVADDLIVFTSRLRNRTHRYLVYDAVAKSLSMIPCLPRRCDPSATFRPLPVRAGGTIALLGRDMRSDSDRQHKRFFQDVLCLCPPPPSTRPPPPSSFSAVSTPWQFMNPLFPPETPSRFKADMVFSSGGQAFWANLAEGVLYCSCHNVLDGGYDVPFRYVPLPPEMNRLRLSRTMNCVKDSIRLVSIDMAAATPDDEAMMTTWTLTLATRQWHKDDELRVSSLWELEGFKKAGLPKAKPTSPVLSMEEDGVLYFMLNAAEQGVYMVSLNMHTKSIISSTRLSSCPYTQPLGNFPNTFRISVFALPPKRDRADLEECSTAIKRRLSRT
uniref:DUF1618 domain-containing protein n=1 Tax=Oryza meridionalis TaxID=40149 RepID=A0A0E0D8A2_9ORYZ